MSQSDTQSLQTMITKLQGSVDHLTSAVESLQGRFSNWEQQNITGSPFTDESTSQGNPVTYGSQTTGQKVGASHKS